MSLSLPAFITTKLYHPLSLSLSVSITTCLYHHMSVSTPVSFIICLCHFLSVSLPFYIITCLYQYLSVAIFSASNRLAGITLLPFIYDIPQSYHIKVIKINKIIFGTGAQNSNSSEQLYTIFSSFNRILTE